MDIELSIGLPVLPVEEVERILKEIESGAYSASNTTIVESKDTERQGNQLHCWNSMPQYEKKEASSPPQLPLPDQEGPDTTTSAETLKSQIPIDDFNFEVVQF
ncbi:unnamed protein product [Strongylus vulgaris]|uniref:Uncharacterized protein n=1 Tax=Strongylus vulgaris TaxID=40348 RepID=A0A3P7J5C9_STRVU|nr:unnamed protein product [Strongylus vulgaris]